MTQTNIQKLKAYTDAAQSCLDQTDILVYRAMEQNVPVDDVLVQYRDELRKIIMFGVQENEIDTFQFPIYPYDLGAGTHE